MACITKLVLVVLAMPRAGTDFLHAQALDDAMLQSEISVVSKISILQPLKA
jgi:hypothetical protein